MKTHKPTEAKEQDGQAKHLDFEVNSREAKRDHSNHGLKKRRCQDRGKG